MQILFYFYIKITHVKLESLYPLFRKAVAS